MQKPKHGLQDSTRALWKSRHKCPDAFGNWMPQLHYDTTQFVDPSKLGDESMVSVKTESLFIAIASTCQRSSLCTQLHVSIERCWLYYDGNRERSPASWLFDILWGLSIRKRPKRAWFHLKKQQWQLRKVTRIVLEGLRAPYSIKINLPSN